MSAISRHANKLLLLILFPLLLYPTNCSKEVNLEPSGILQLCPGSNIAFVCTNNHTSVLAWRSFEQDHPDGDPYFFNDGSDVDMMERSSGSFTVVLLSTSPLVSTATLTNSFGLQQNGTNLTCSSTTSTTTSPSNRDYAVLILKDPPDPPTNLVLSLHSISNAVLSWTHPNDSTCITSYILTLTNITEGNVSYWYNTSSNTTCLNVTDLNQGAEYSFSVAGVDAGDRIGEISTPSDFITADTPERITSLENHNEPDATSISLTWMPPPSSSRPPVLGYKITHNTTGHSLVNQTSDTTFFLDELNPGVYLFSVWAFNVLGDGVKEAVAVTIATVSSTKSMPSSTVTTTSSSTSKASGTSGTSGTSSNSGTSGTSTQVPSTVTKTTNEANTSSDINIYIFVALGVITLVVTIMAVLLFVLLVISIKNRKDSSKSSGETVIKECLPKQMTFSENQAYSSFTSVPMNEKSFDNCIKHEVLYETIK